MYRNAFGIDVSRAARGIYRLHISSSGQADCYVRASHIREARALLDRAIAEHEASAHVAGMRFHGTLAPGAFSGSWLRLCIDRQVHATWVASQSA